MARRRGVVGRKTLELWKHAATCHAWAGPWQGPTNCPLSPSKHAPRQGTGFGWGACFVGKSRWITEPGQGPDEAWHVTAASSVEKPWNFGSTRRRAKHAAACHAWAGSWQGPTNCLLSPPKHAPRPKLRTNRSEAERSEAERSEAERSEAERSEAERSEAERSEASHASPVEAETLGSPARDPTKHGTRHSSKLIVASEREGFPSPLASWPCRFAAFVGG